MLAFQTFLEHLGDVKQILFSPQRHSSLQVAGGDAERRQSQIKGESKSTQGSWGQRSSGSKPGCRPRRAWARGAWGAAESPNWNPDTFQTPSVCCFPPGIYGERTKTI